MPTRYTLVLHNDSTAPGAFCVFQTIPMQEQHKDLFSLAWLVKDSRPGGEVSCYWDNNYSFMWGESGQLTPGLIFRPNAFVDTDHADVNKNSIGFLQSNDYGNYFEKVDRQTPAGSLGIYCYNVSHSHVAVGMAMAGMGVFAYSAKEHSDLVVHLTGKKYWVAFGDFHQGEALDLEKTLPRAFELAFTPDQHKLEMAYDSEKRLKML